AQHQVAGGQFQVLRAERGLSDFERAAFEAPRLRSLAFGPPQRGQAAEAQREVARDPRLGLFADIERAFEQASRLRQSALVQIEKPEIHERLRSERIAALFPNREGSLVQRLRFLEVPSPVQERREVVEARREGGLVLPTLPDLDRLLIELARPRVVAKRL